MYHTSSIHASYLSLLSSCRGKFSTEKFKHYSRLSETRITSNNTSKNTVYSASKTQRSDTFEQYLKDGREQAKKSIIVNVQSGKSIHNLTAYCSQYAKLNSVYHYTTDKSNHCALLEFNSEQDVDTVMSNAVYVNKNTVIPTRANFLWFRNNILEKEFRISSAQSQKIKTFLNSTTSPSERYIYDVLKSAETVSNQIELLYNLFKLNETENKLRFCTAYQVEKNLQSLFPDLQVLPFGSSVNGFGRQGCDLDLVMSLMDYDEDDHVKSTKRLVYLVKTQTDEYLKTKNIMETVANTMQFLVPCIVNVKRILNATVPIIKFTHTMTGLECDLSTTNMTAIYMTELMFMYGRIDWKVKPLVFVIRKWASSVRITNTSPGPWITNFPLTLMVLFFLQQKNILPTLKYLRDLAGKDDIRIADGNVDCTYIRDMNLLKKKQKNKDSLEQLLLDFFQFYSDFDFNTRAISLREGKAIVKPNSTPLYICNPLETSKNVSKNVNYHEMERLQNGMKSANMLLKSSNKNDGGEWGLLKLFSPNQIISPKKTVKVDMKQILRDDEDSENLNGSERLNEMMETLQENMERIKRR